MTNLTILEHNATTGEIVERPMTEAEIVAAKADAAITATAKATAALKKQEVLAKLGLTADEVTALLA